MSLLAYEFMRRAFFVGILLALIVPCIGVVVVLRRLSMIGDALSHASLAGVAGGLVLGINPVLGAVVMSILAALGIEAVRKKIPRYAELSIAVVLSAGVGLAGILGGFLPNSGSFNSFLFGSIVAIDDFELGLVSGVGCFVLAAFLLFYKELFFLSLDQRGARLAGVPVRAVAFLFTILTAVTISVAARAVGALVISSLMVIPVTCAMQVGRSYRQTVLWSVGFALLFTVTGITLSYYADLRPGATIVLTGLLCLMALLAAKPLRRRAARAKE